VDEEDVALGDEKGDLCASERPNHVFGRDEGERVEQGRFCGRVLDGGKGERRSLCRWDIVKHGEMRVGRRPGWGRTVGGGGRWAV
jgi:hypothetical protein